MRKASTLSLLQNILALPLCPVKLSIDSYGIVPIDGSSGITDCSTVTL